MPPHAQASKQADRWQAPGVPDATAGEWPPDVVAALAEMVAGLTEEYSEDRMPLSEALEKLEEILKTYPAEPPPAQPEVAKDCEICMERPREVRFACGHCVVCTECLGVIRAAAQTNARKADESLHPKVREDAAKLTIARCPTCDEPIGEKLADSGAQLGTEPTFELSSESAAGESAGAAWCRRSRWPRTWSWDGAGVAAAGRASEYELIVYGMCLCLTKKTPFRATVCYPST